MQLRGTSELMQEEVGLTLTLMHSCTGLEISITNDYYAPPLIGGGIKRCLCLTSDVCLTSGVCLSRTSGVTREHIGLGRPKLAQR